MSNVRATKQDGRHAGAAALTCLALVVAGPASAASGDGRVVYGVAGNTAPQVRPFSAASATFGAAAGAVAGGVPLQTRIAASPSRIESIAGTVDSAGTLRVLRWNGFAWSSEWSVSVGGNGTNGRRFDVAYESTSGRAVVVYSRGASNNLGYRIWDGSTWTAEATFDSARITGTYLWVKLEARPGSNELAALLTDGANDLTVMVWSGAAWAGEPGAALETNLENSGTAGAFEAFDLAYESTSGDLLVAWGTNTTASGVNGVRYATRSAAGVWSGAQTPPTFVDDATNLDLAADPASNNILLASVGNQTSNLQAGVWNGTSWTNRADLDTAVSTPAAGSRLVSCAWLRNSVARGLCVYGDAANAAIDWAVLNGTTWTLQTDWTPGLAIGTETQLDVHADPLNPDRAIVTIADSAGDLWAKLVTMSSAGAFTWADAEGGAALTTTLAGTGAQAFDYAHDRYAPSSTLAGTATATSAACGTLSVSAPWAGDGDGDNSLSYRYRTPSGTGAWVGPATRAHAASPYAFDLTGLSGGTYDVEVTWVDPDGVTGTAVQTVSGVAVAACNFTSAGTASLTVDSCTQVTVRAPFTLDANGSGTVKVERNTVNDWTSGVTTVCAAAGGASPRTCVDSTAQQSSSYWYRVTWVDADGVTGTSPQVLGPASTPLCPIPPTTTGTLTATATGCSVVQLSASFGGDVPTANGTTTFQRATAAGGPFTSLTGCAGVTGASPRTCTDSGTAATTSYWYRAQFTDPDGVVGTNPLETSVTTSQCIPELTLSSPGQPAGGSITVGGGGVVVGMLQFVTDTGTATLTSLAVTNSGAAPQAVADQDLASLLLVEDASPNAVLAAAQPVGGKYVFSGLAYAVSTTPKTFRVVASATYGATAARTFRMSVASADVVAADPATVKAGISFSGNPFTIAAPSAAIVEGSTAANTAAPMVSILNPMDGGIVNGPFRLQVHVYSATGARLANLTGVNLSTDGTAPDCSVKSAAFTESAKYLAPAASFPNEAILEATLDPSDTARFAAAKGAYTIRVCARNATGTVNSRAVTVSVRPAGKGDGNLLARDNSSQLCTDCHAVKTHSSQTTAPTSGTNKGKSKYGAWATTCRDCHQPHGTPNAYLFKDRVTPPSAAGAYQPSRAVRFWDPTVGDSASGPKPGYVNAANDGPCQVCHTRTDDRSVPAAPGTGVARWRNTGNADSHYRSADGGGACTDCHTHTVGFAGAESDGRVKCGGCHKGVSRMMTGTDGAGTGSKPYKHSLVGFTDTPTDSTVAWNGASLSLNAPAQRSCVNMCHTDHVHNAPAGTSHDANVHGNAATQASRQVTRNPAPPTGDYMVTAGTPARTDFDPATNAGMCVSCHQKPISATRTATIDGTRYNASAHDYVVGGGSTWQYAMHDGASFDRNCTKCHASRAEGSTPQAGGVVTAVHGTDDPKLLAGKSTPAGSAAGFVCYNCHGSTASPAAGAQGNRSGKNVQSQVAKTSRHNTDADAVHDSNAEFNGTYPLGARHVSCMDCHDPHSATAANPLQNAPGVVPTNSTAGAAPTAYTFARVANPDHQYQTCFRCHTNWQGQTVLNLAVAFNPANDSLHFVEADKGAVPVNTTGTGKGIWKNATFNLNAVPGQGTRRYVDVMMPRTGVTHTDATLRSLPLRCSDCHGDDAADGGNAVPEGPHGSTRSKLLKTPAGSPYTVWNSTVMYQGGSGTIWCFNCHNPSFTGTGFMENSSSNIHLTKHEDRACQNCHLANPHGQTGVGAAAQRKHLLSPTRFNDNVDNKTSGAYGEDHSVVAQSNCT